LPKEIFDVEINPDLIHQVVVAQTANRRRVIAHTKGRGEVRGGGKKPWRQKGTGRARHGSIRSPLWKGGGVTFGPTKERTFKKEINKKMKRKALFMVLTAKAKNNLLLVLDKIILEQPKTK
jgi:large subunit ribosomal protein L4